MFEVMIEESFSAAHRLLDYEGKTEEDIHGHTWKVQLYVTGEYIDTSGILIDFKVLSKDLKEVLDILDHTDLNSLKEFKDLSPSSELIAKFIYKNLKTKIPGLSRVSVLESEKHKASYWE
jgi:6-pyruvoyltetrahydropterin/6-carboxytetrahydropterin synthase